MQKNIDLQNLQPQELAQYIDHTLLKPQIYKAEIKTLCDEALEHNFFGVCINSSMLPFAREFLRGSEIRIISVVGFPLGACEINTKSFETSRCINMGAHEIDVVLNIGALKAGEFALTKREIEEVVRAAEGRPVKVILETALLENAEKRKACELAVEAGAHFVKTCTGFGGGGATIEDVQLMKLIASPRAQVKASGGIRDFTTAKAMILAGATRLGTSSGVKIIQSSIEDTGSNSAATGDY